MPRGPAVWLSISTGLLIPWLSASGQFADLQPGARIRFRAPSEVAGRLTGMVVSRVADSIVVTRQSSTPISVRVSSFVSLEISRGKSHGRGALKGLAWAVPIGLVLGLTPISDSTCGIGSVGCEPVSRGAFIGSTVLGSAFIGAGIGAIVGSERWEPMTLPAKVGLLPPSRRRGPGLGVQVAFGGPVRRD